jgi:hypothetical protein
MVLLFVVKTLGCRRLKEVKKIEEELKAAQKKLITLNENDSEYDDTVNEIYRLRDEKLRQISLQFN